MKTFKEAISDKKVQDFLSGVYSKEGTSPLIVAIDDGDKKKMTKILSKYSKDKKLVAAAVKVMFGENFTEELMEGTSEIQELELFIQNNELVYTKKLVPLVKQISKNTKAGKYDQKKALKAMTAVVLFGVKHFAREFAREDEKDRIFSKADVKSVALSLVKEFEDEIRVGNW